MSHSQAFGQLTWRSKLVVLVLVLLTPLHWQIYAQEDVHGQLVAFRRWCSAWAAVLVVLGAVALLIDVLTGGGIGRAH